MKNTVTEIINHPIASFFIIGVIFDGIIGIIRAVKGTPMSPVPQIEFSKDTTE